MKTNLTILEEWLKEIAKTNTTVQIRPVLTQIVDIKKELKEIQGKYWKNPYAAHPTMIQLLEEVLG